MTHYNNTTKHKKSQSQLSGKSSHRHINPFMTTNNQDYGSSSVTKSKMVGFDDNENVIKGFEIMNRDTSNVNLPIIEFNTTATYMGSLKMFNKACEPKKTIIDKYKPSTIKEFGLTTEYLSGMIGKKTITTQDFIDKNKQSQS